MSAEPIVQARERAQVSASGIGAAYHHRVAAMHKGADVAGWRGAVTVADTIGGHEQVLVGVPGADPFLAVDPLALATLVEEAAGVLQGEGTAGGLTPLLAARDDDPVFGLDLLRFDADAAGRIAAT